MQKMKKSLELILRKFVFQGTFTLILWILHEFGNSCKIHKISVKYCKFYSATLFLEIGSNDFIQNLLTVGSSDESSITSNDSDIKPVNFREIFTQTQLFTLILH